MALHPDDLFRNVEKNGSLATGSGVALNSMVDRRQLATRYAVQVEVALNIDNKLIVNHETSEVFRESSTIPWAVLHQAIRQFVKAQIVQARSLHYHEICHVQCMILLPRVIQCKTIEELDSLELELYDKGFAAEYCY
ncbi:hypothetical protein NECAME_17132 [Necator americanus]|uniref:Uncharacterized protein n=1 Tax=Necator americanus TaxID=51031 RepID=W2TRQ7_NECAM|nr:hypothetical protein NECAME_17132 [Necator americanus]ETN84498.1 hypothetical protein NECAME_17132 [Necator americanus]